MHLPSPYHSSLVTLARFFIFVLAFIKSNVTCDSLRKRRKIAAHAQPKETPASFKELTLEEKDFWSRDLLSMPKKSNSYVLINVAAGRGSGYTMQLPLDSLPNQTAQGLLSTVAERINVDLEYVVMYKNGPVRGTENIRKYRLPSQRIGTTSTCRNSESLNSMTLESLDIKSSDSVTCVLRPLRGDHIHQAFAVYVHDELVDTLWDRGWVGTPDMNEGNTYPLSYENLSENLWNYHITNVQPHFGIHSGQEYWFGDGLIHVHPGTSWEWFQGTEGLGATLDAYLGQVGAAWYDTESTRCPYGQWHLPMLNRSTELTGMVFPNTTGGLPTMVGGEYDYAAIAVNGTKGQNIGPNRHPLRDFETISHTSYEMTKESIIINSNATHLWRMYYYSYYDDAVPTVLEHSAGELWLNENLAMVVLSFERRDRDPLISPMRPPKGMVDVLSNYEERTTGTPIPNQQSNFYMLGFDGCSYPMANAPGVEWPLPKPQWVASPVN